MTHWVDNYAAVDHLHLRDGEPDEDGSHIWNPHTWKFRGIYLVYPRVMTIYVVRQGYTRYIPVI